MKINLIPHDAQQSIVVKRRRWGFIAVCLAILTAMAATYWSVWHQVSEKRAMVVALQETQERLVPSNDKAKLLSEAKRKLQDAQAARAFLVPSSSLSAILVELSQTIPPDVTLREVSVADGGVVTIKAQGQAVASAAQLLGQLSKMKTLSNPKIGDIHADGATGFVFDLSCRIAKGAVQP